MQPDKSTLESLVTPTSEHTAEPFLEIPPEIRNRIYGYCTPIDGHPRDYFGLLASCKQIKHEFSTEACKVFKRSLEKVEHEYRFNPPLRITASSSLATLTVELPSLGLLKSSTQEPHELVSDEENLLDPGIASLLNFHLDKVRIKLYDPVLPIEHYQRCLSPRKVVEGLDKLLYGCSYPEHMWFSETYGRGGSSDLHPGVNTRKLSIESLSIDNSGYMGVRRRSSYAKCRILAHFSVAHSMVEDFSVDHNAVLRFTFNPPGIRNSWQCLKFRVPRMTRGAALNMNL